MADLPVPESAGRGRLSSAAVTNHTGVVPARTFEPCCHPQVDDGPCGVCAVLAVVVAPEREAELDADGWHRGAVLDVEEGA